MAIGGGVYEATCLTNGLTFGNQVDWDDTMNGITDGTSGSKNIGYAVSSTASNGDKINFYHQHAG